MKAIWEFLLSGLAESFGKDLGQLIAWISLFFFLLGLLIPFYLLMKALGYRARPYGRGTTSSEDVIEAIISSPAEALISPSRSGQIPESRNEFIQSLENVKRSGLEIYKYLTYAVVALLIAGGIYYASVATTANGLILVAVLLFGIAAIVFVQMERFQQLMTWTPSTNITRTVMMAEPTVVKMGIDAMQKAQDLLTAGKDMDSVCREIEPEYANWGSVQQQVFRKMLEAVLKLDRSKRTWVPRA